MCARNSILKFDCTFTMSLVSTGSALMKLSNTLKKSYECRPNVTIIQGKENLESPAHTVPKDGFPIKRKANL